MQLQHWIAGVPNLLATDSAFGLDAASKIHLRRAQSLTDLWLLAVRARESFWDKTNVLRSTIHGL